MELMFAAFGFLLMLAVFPGIAELALLTLGGVFPPRPSPAPADSADERGLRFCVVVPAHDEGPGIAACVQSLRQCLVGPHVLELVVIADNCTDDTAERAESAGARVLVRRDDQCRGKGYALAFAFDLLLREPHDVFIVIDADSRVEPNLITAMASLFQRGADAAQCRYLVSNPDATQRTRLMQVAWLAFNLLRLRGREFWGCSVGILGNGFALSRQALERVPFNVNSIAEDLDYHIRFVSAGCRVRFCESTTVWAPAPATSDVASAQRARWEGGRFRLIVERLPSLVCSVGRGQWRLLEPAMDLMLLPLVFHVILLLILVFIPWPPARWMGWLGLIVVIVHILSALVIGKASRQQWMALAGAPVYMLWKLALGKRLMAAARKNAAWVRTTREETGD